MEIPRNKEEIKKVHSTTESSPTKIIIDKNPAERLMR